MRNTIGDGKTQFRVQCDQWLDVAKARDIHFDVSDVRFCQVGKKLLPVLSKDGEGIRGNVTRGRLQPRHIQRGLHDWERILVANERLDSKTFQVYMVTDVLSHGGQVIVSSAFVLGAIGLGVMWIRVRRQRRKLLADAMAVI
jgi:hypothetical protein